jgi:hypothetical protein
MSCLHEFFSTPYGRNVPCLTRIVPLTRLCARFNVAPEFNQFNHQPNSGPSSFPNFKIVSGGFVDILAFKTPSRVSSETGAKKKAQFGRLTLLALFILGLSSWSFAANVAVGNCTALAFYPTISQAISSVPGGSTIRICPGTYPEQLFINKSLTLVGVSANGNAGATAVGADNPVITSPASGTAVNAADLFDQSAIAAQIYVFTPAAAAHPTVVSISNLTVDGSNNQINTCATDLVGVYYQNANGTINHIAARNQMLPPGFEGCQGGLAIFVESGYGTGGGATVNITNNSVHDYDKNGITVDGSGTSATITGNYVVGIGATPQVAQNGIQVSDGATGKVSNNTVTGDVYISPDGGPYFSASGILLYDSGGVNGAPITVSGNFITDTQAGVVTFGDSAGTADFNNINGNRIMSTLAAGPFLIDGIDLCSNNNNANSNQVFNSAGAGVHIDSECTESTGQSGFGSTATGNTVSEACAGVLLGTNGGAAAQTLAYNVAVTSATGDFCPSAPSAKVKARPRPQPKRP